MWVLRKRYDVKEKLLFIRENMLIIISMQCINKLSILVVIGKF